MKLLFVAIALLTSLFARAETLTFVGNANLEPMVYLDGNTARGLVVDLTEAVIDAAGLDGSVKAMDWSRAQQQVGAGQGDALIQINPNPKRLETLAFSDPLLVTDFVLFRRIERNDLGSATTLDGQRIGAETDSYPAQLLSGIAGVEAIDLPTLEEGLIAASNGQLDGVVADKWVGLYQLKALGIRNLVPARVPLATSTSRIAVLKDRTELLADINRGLRLIDENGQRQRILRQWSSTEVVLLSQAELRQWGWIAAGLLALTIAAAVTAYVWSLKRRHRRAQASAVELAGLNSRLALSNEQLMRFTFLSSHHFQEPLRQISLNLSLMHELNDTPISEPAQQHLDLVDRGARDMRVMINDLLDYAQVGQSRTDDIIDLNLVAVSAMDALNHRITEHGCRITLHDLPMVRGDRLQLIKLFTHLIGNAITFSRDGEPPRITLSAEQHGGHWH
ncbi:MAG: transporter substrate-binding domain-containing protein, partial [Litorivicinus sp.]